ncbi:hypothetical protein Bbelb_017300 [Branchiostoma belcheri]|nr:hypothetical protein Bbelb_017300 [Branchiostoma belcheri]
MSSFMRGITAEVMKIDAQIMEPSQPSALMRAKRAGRVIKRVIKNVMKTPNCGQALGPPLTLSPPQKKDSEYTTAARILGSGSAGRHGAWIPVLSDSGHQGATGAVLKASRSRQHHRETPDGRVSPAVKGKKP